jgi:predicted DNA-binding antitoxin AbrB/MazE fold protein
MVHTFDAVYENGVFRPLAQELGISDGQRVRIVVTATEPATDDPLLALAGAFECELTDEVAVRTTPTKALGRGGRQPSAYHGCG